MKKKPPSFPWYAKDFLVGTAEMTNEEVGIYARLLSHQWDRGFVQKDKAARIVGAKKIPADVLAKFVDTNGELRNERLEAVRQEKTEYHEQQSVRGKVGAKAKWEAARDGTGHASANGEPMAPPSSGQRPNGSSASASAFSSSNPTTTIPTDWPVVEAELFAVGLKAAGGTVTLARGRDFTPARVREAIAFWEKHPEWGAGAIHDHIKHTPPTVTAEQGWWPESDGTSQTASSSHQLKNAERLSSMPHAELREVLEWSVEVGLVRSMPLEQFDDDPDYFLKIIPNQTLLTKLLSARDDATSNRAPTDSSAPKHERTPHGKEASTLPAQSL